jgi:hypothetical protein
VSFEPLDLDRGLPVTPEDVVVLRERRERLPPMTFREYLVFLQSVPSASPEQLRQRGGPRGEPFRLL